MHPFESYVKFLLANGENPDTVITNISYDLNADSMELLFTPLRGISDEEYELVKTAQADPETKKYVQLTVSSTDGAKTAPKQEEPKPEPKVIRSDEPDDEEEAVFAPVEEPVKRSAKKEPLTIGENKNLASIVDAWGDDD